MNIKEFKIGDVITRNEGIKYEHNGSVDSSYCGDRLILKGFDDTAKIIFLGNTEKWNEGDITDLSFARDKWDEGWCPYPETMWQSFKKNIG